MVSDGAWAAVFLSAPFAVAGVSGLGFGVGAAAGVGGGVGAGAGFGAGAVSA